MLSKKTEIQEAAVLHLMETVDTFQVYVMSFIKEESVDPETFYFGELWQNNSL